MYSVLLVEDEKIELDTLRDYINWERISVDKVYTARNGRSALECIEQKEPDIMITDIQMPIMTGIELAKRVREEGYKTRIIFLTGYDDFEYVKEAFKVQAADYILKPFMTEEVEKLLLRIEKEIDSEKTAEVSVHVAAKHMIEQLCRGDLKAEETEPLSLRYFKHPLKEVTFGLSAVYGAGTKELLYRNGDSLPEVYHSFLIGDVLVTVLHSHLYFWDGAKRIRNILGGNYSIACFKEKIPLNCLKERTEQLVRLKERIFFQAKGEIYDACKEEAGKQNSRQTDNLHTFEGKENLLKAIKSGEVSRAEAELRSVLEGFTLLKKEDCIREAFGFFYELKSSLAAGDPQLALWLEEREEGWEQNILTGTYWEDILKVMVSYCNCIISFYAKQQENPNYHIIARIKDYLEHNYSGVCSVEEMAEEVHLSPNYLRSLFKDSMGQTILEYVTDYRLLKACELLKDKTLRVKEVGRLVGYENESYFGTVFAKKYGVTPNEYRKMV